MDLLFLANDMLAKAALWEEGELPFAAAVENGHPRVVVVGGENCSGKSFFVEALRSWAVGLKTINISISIRERTGAGSSDGGMRRQMMFGDESRQSTGATSVRVLALAFANMASRDEAGHRCMLVLDEPELGLSDGFAGAMGAWLARCAMDLPKSSPGVVIVSHSRSLVRALAAELGQAPTFVKMGQAQGLGEWLVRPEEHSVDELLALTERNRKHRQIVRDAIDRVRELAADANPTGARRRAVARGAR